MELALQNTIKHFKINNVYKVSDFTFIDDKIHISMEKVEYMLGNEYEFPQSETVYTFDDENGIYTKEYVPFKVVYDLVESETINLKTVVRKAMMKQVKTHDTGTYGVIIDEVKPQISFTYSLTTFINKYFPNLEFKIENNFLSLERFNDIYIGPTKGPRMDIVFDEIFLVIEYDEKHHKRKEQKEADKTRDAFMIGHGYEVLRVVHGENLDNFFTKLKQIIRDRYLRFNPNSYPKYIIDMFVEQGYDEDQVKILVEEIAQDIVSGTDVLDLGNKVGEMTFGMLMNYLRIHDCEEQQEYIDKLKTSKYKYVDNENIEEIKLSPNALEYILNFVDANLIFDVIQFRELYTGIKNTLLYIVFNNAKEHLENFHKRINVTSIIINETYRRCEHDKFTEEQSYEKKQTLLDTKEHVIKQIYESTLPRDGRGVKKINIIEVSNNLVNNEPFIPELPQLLYSSNNGDYVNMDELMYLLEFNKRKYKINNAFRKISRCIKNKVTYNPNENVVYNCKLVY